MSHPFNDRPSMGRVERIHFVGIGGSGMCGIAEVLLNEGYQISGSDLNETAVTQRLAGLGATIYQGHEADHIAQVDVVVQSTAISDDNPEIHAALALHIPVVKRAEMLAELMRFRYGIAVAGTHGKTTTTSLVSSILGHGGLDPTFVIGGMLNGAGSNAKLGESPYLVAEADESDASFLYLKPMIAIVTNIDRDHMETYDGNFDKLLETFLTFLHHLPFYGLAVLCLDDPVIKNLLPSVGRSFLTYGFDPDADVRAYDYRQEGTMTLFKVARPAGDDFEVALNMPGKHNVQNALAAISVAMELGVEDEAIIEALAKFAGIGRRFHIHGELDIDNKKVLLVDDYGHHPREIASTVEAARAAWPDRRLVMVFQPHRFSRTQELFDDFSKELSKVDTLLMLDVYSAGESPISGADSASLCRNIRKRGNIEPIYVGADELSQVLAPVIEQGDIVLTQGAGSVGQAALELKKIFGQS